MDKKPDTNKEETAENWCFICKDGGELRICDHEKCPKSYHPSCLEEDDSFLESDMNWACAWHTCYNCPKSSYVRCYTCPHAVCRSCLSVADADFQPIKGPYGFCGACLYLALLIEGKREYDSDGDRVDFGDRDTCEGLFMEYYLIVKEKEGFELGGFHAAEDGMTTINESKSDSEEIIVENDQMSDSDDAEYVTKRRRTCNEKRSRRKKTGKQTPTESNKNDFVGWGSRSLIEFLSSIGKSTSEKMSQLDVIAIVSGYVNENKLLHPEKKKTIVCDRALYSLFKKKTVRMNRVYELLEPHFAENDDESEESEVGSDSEDDNADIPAVRKLRRKLNLEWESSEKERRSPKKQLADNLLLSCFAAITVENIKLVYLRRSLILEMRKHPITFEEKVVGCFVRVKPDQCSKNPCQLMKVRGVQRVSADQNNTEVFLLCSDVPEEISTSRLSDDDFSKEELEDLRKRIFAGQLERPKVEDLQQKANLLHEDITKHWIKKELALLRNLIDQANEKGWRCELFEHLKKQRTLQNPSEVSKLLENGPLVIPDRYNPSDRNIEKESPKSILQCTSSVANDECRDPKASEEKKEKGQVEAEGEKLKHERKTRKARETVIDLVEED